MSVAAVREVRSLSRRGDVEHHFGRRDLDGLAHAADLEGDTTLSVTPASMRAGSCAAEKPASRNRTM